MPRAGGRTDTLQACSDPQQWARARDGSEWLSAKLHADRATCLARCLDRCTGRASFALGARLDMCSFRVEAFLPPVAGGPAPVDIRTVQEILTYRSSAQAPLAQRG